jgi:signal transduction histidine kinase/ligand-binding sensor domain-containing protein
MFLKTVKCLSVFILSSILTTAACAQELTANLIFRNLSITDGLASNTVLSITQDSKGRMWIGTAHGLSLFDGSSFTIYKHTESDTNSIIDNYISAITEAPDGNLWIGCGGGLSIYNPEKDHFINLNTLLKSGDEIRLLVTCIVFENDEFVWIGTSEGLFRLNFSTKELTYFDNSWLKNTITQIYFDRNRNIWIGTQSEGVVFYNRQNNQFSKFKNEKPQEHVRSVNTARSIIEDSRGNIWVGSDLGLELYTPETKSYRTYYYDPNNPKGPLQNMVRTIFEDNQKRLWVGFKNGLTIFDRDQNEFIRIKNQPGNPRSIAAEEVWCMTQDSKGSVWFGFYTSGISIFDYDKAQFKSFQNNPKDPNSLCGNYVNNFCEDKNENLWIATGHMGFDYYNFKTNTFTHYKNDPKNKNSLSSDAVLCIDIDHEGVLWIGTWGGGLNRFDPKTNRFTNYFPRRNDSTSINGIHIWRALEDKHNNLLIATQQEGLGYYIREKNIFKKYKHDPTNKNSLTNNSVNCIYRDHENIIWIGTGRGLSKLDNDQFVFKNFLGDSAYIYDIYNDQKGTLWIATGGGLFAFDLKNETVKAYTADNGLGSNSVVGILEDSHNQLWVSTFNGGLSIINIETRKIQNLTVNDGLVSLSFKKRARLKLSDGRMVFGTNEGFILFHPDSIKIDFPAPKVILSDFRVYYKSIAIGEKDAPLTKHITFADTIKLNHNQSVSTIYYTALNFIAPEKNNYAYLLEGFDKEWNYVGTKRDANYTNLDPGTYTFRVKVSVNKDTWSDEEASITIIITPPFYMTWWFRIAMVLFILLAIVSVFFARHEQVRKANILLKKLVDERTREIEKKNKILYNQTIDLNKRQEQIEEQAEELIMANNKLLQLNATKDTFFSILAHDLRNPFNSILGFTEILNNSDQKIAEDEIKIINKQLLTTASTTYELLENLLEWSRTQSNRIAFEPKPTDIDTLIAEVTQVFNSNTKAITINYKSTGKIPIVVDANMIKTVLRNLLSNAIKFSHPNGTITVYAEKSDQYVTVTVSDNGIGIKSENLNKLFDFTQKFSSTGTAQEKGTGLGLIICKEFVEKHGGKIWVESDPDSHRGGKGSDFKFTIPMRK